MFFILHFVLLVVAWCFWWYKTDQKYYRKYPPGPPRLPILGNLLQIRWKSDFPAEAFAKLAETYGDVMFLKMGGGEAVVFTSPDSIRKILTHDKANDRSEFEFVKDRHDNKNMGIIFGNGQPWVQLRRFTVRNLRDFGFGKSAVMDVVINEEIDKFVDHLLKQLSKANDNILLMEDCFSLTVVNVLWRLMSGQSYDYNDPKMLRLLKLNSAFFRSTNVGLDLTDVYPFLRYLFPNWSGRTLQRKASQDLYDYGKELLDEHLKRGTYAIDPQSFIDVFTAKVEESKDDPDTNFTREQFVMCILDLLVAGSETSSNVLSFSILYMLHNPEVQAKVQDELDKHIPKNVPMELTMKSKLPYTTATVLEIYRYATIGPIPIPRRATGDFYFLGHFIKKGTSLIPDVYAAHHSKILWDNPHIFRPERFLNSARTQVNSKVADLLLTFGAGKRICLGESLADATIFLYFTVLMRKFKFVKVPGTNPSVKPKLAINLFPETFPVQIIEINK